MTVRLLRIMVQPVYVDDDGEQLRELPPVQPVVVNPGDWDTFASDGLDRMHDAVVEQLEQQQPDPERDGGV